MTVLISKYKRGNFCLKAPLGIDDNFTRLSRLPAFKKWDGRLLIFRPASSNIDYILDNWPDAIWSGETEETMIEHKSNAEKALELRSNKKLILEDDGSYEYKTKPFDHQRQMFLISRDSSWFAYLTEMGTGKSKVAIDNAAYLYSKGEIDCLVVVAPNGVHRNWIINEIPVHMPDWCPISMDFYSSKHGKKRMSSVYDVLLDKTKLAIIAINVEAFSSQKAKDFMENVLFSRKCMVVLDESTTIKNPTGKRSKFLTDVCRDVPYKRIANGAPITKGIEDLYAQFGFLSHSILGFDTFTGFKSQYCEEIEIPVNRADPDGRKFRKITSYKNVDDLVDKIDGYSMRVLKKDCLDLPEKTYTLWPVDMTHQQKKAYMELKDEYMTQIESTYIEEELAIVRLLRLQQISCGWYPSEEEEKLIPIPGGNPRMDALKEIVRQVEEAGEKAIIWARFKQDIYAIEELLGDKAVSYHGDIGQEERVEAGHRFQNDDSIKFMIGILSSNSGAVRGHTWTAASTTIYYSNIFDLDPRQQSEDRMHRIGMGEKALYIDLMALGTIDRKIIDALKAKKSISDLVTRDGPTGFLDFVSE